MEIKLSYGTLWNYLIFSIIEGILAFSICLTYFSNSSKWQQSQNQSVPYILIVFMVIHAIIFEIVLSKSYSIDPTGISIFRWKKLNKTIPWNKIDCADDGGRYSIIEFEIYGDYPILIPIPSSKSQTKLLYQIVTTNPSAERIKPNLADSIAHSNKKFAFR